MKKLFTLLTMLTMALFIAGCTGEDAAKPAGDGAGTTPSTTPAPEGEGEKAPEGEGEKAPEGEGEKAPEGEGEKEAGSTPE